MADMPPNDTDWCTLSLTGPFWFLVLPLEGTWYNSIPQSDSKPGSTTYLLCELGSVTRPHEFLFLHLQKENDTLTSQGWLRIKWQKVKGGCSRPSLSFLWLLTDSQWFAHSALSVPPFLLLIHCCSPEPSPLLGFPSRFVGFIPSHSKTCDSDRETTGYPPPAAPYPTRMKLMSKSDTWWD